MRALLIQKISVFYKKNKGSRFAFTLSIVVSLSLSATGFSQNLISNGSFENATGGTFAGTGRSQFTSTNTITSWNITGVNDVYLHQTPQIGDAIGAAFNSSQQGDYYLDLSGSGGAHPTVSQSFATNPGQNYQLTFYIGATGTPSASINVQMLGAASILNTTLTPDAATTSINWSLQTFNFSADSSITSLLFQDTTSIDDNASYVDNIQIVPVPEPTIIGLVGLVGIASLARLRRCCDFITV